MTEQEKLGGNISLIDFGKLEPTELVIVKKITGTYVKKLSERTNYKELRIRLKQHEQGKSFLHEIDAEAIVFKHGQEGQEVKLSASITDRNLYSALSAVLEKLISETEHIKRSTKEIGEENKRKQKVAEKETKETEDEEL